MAAASNGAEPSDSVGGAPSDPAVVPAVDPKEADASALPSTTRVMLDGSVRRVDDGRVLIGGSPLRLLRLTSSRSEGDRPAGIGCRGGRRCGSRAAWLDGCSTGAWSIRVWCRTAGRAAEVTVVIPVYDRVGGLERTLAAIGGHGCPAGGRGRGRRRFAGRWPGTGGCGRRGCDAGAGAGARAGVAIGVGDGDGAQAGAGADAGMGLGRTGTRLGLVGSGVGVRLVARAVNGGPGAARNSGLEVVDTPLVAFVDAEVEVASDWLDRLLPHFDDPAVAAVAPRVLPPVRPIRCSRPPNQPDPPIACPRWDRPSAPIRYRIGAHGHGGGQAPGAGGRRVARSAAPSPATTATRSPLDLGPDPARVAPRTGWPTCRRPRWSPGSTRCAAVGGFDESAQLRRGRRPGLAPGRGRVHRAVRAGGDGSATPCAADLAAGCASASTTAARPPRFRPAAPEALAGLGVGVERGWPGARRRTGFPAWPPSPWGRPAPAPARPASRIRGSEGAASGRRRHLGGVATVGLRRHPHLVARGARCRARCRAALGARRGARGDRAAARRLVGGDRELDPVSYLALRVLDDLAYGAGVWVGCARERTVLPLVPDLTPGPAAGLPSIPADRGPAPVSPAGPRHPVPAPPTVWPTCGWMSRVSRRSAVTDSAPRAMARAVAGGRRPRRPAQASSATAWASCSGARSRSAASQWRQVVSAMPTMP